VRVLVFVGWGAGGLRGVLCDILFEFLVERNFTVAFTVWSSLKQRNLLSTLLLGAFAKLKSDCFFLMFVRPSLRME
jgi:hypothetical protein